MSELDHKELELAQRRAAARRTALILGGVVLVIFGVFVMTGVLGRN